MAQGQPKPNYDAIWLMNPAELQQQIMGAINFAMQKGTPPVVVVGILEFIKLDIYSSMREQAKASPIIKG